MEERRAHDAVVSGGVVFGVVVTEVFYARGVVDQKMALSCTIGYPVEFHIHGLRTLEFDGAVSETVGR